MQGSCESARPATGRRRSGRHIKHMMPASTRTCTMHKWSTMHMHMQHARRLRLGAQGMSATSGRGILPTFTYANTAKHIHEPNKLCAKRWAVGPRGATVIAHT
jgi:hypothetical protein